MARFWIVLITFSLCVQGALAAEPGHAGPRRSDTRTNPPARSDDNATKAVKAAGPARALQAPGPVPFVMEDATTVLQLNSVPADNLAATINSLLSAEGQIARGGRASSRVTIVADSISNSLVMTGSAEAVEAIQQLAAKLDRTAAMVRLEVVVGEVPSGTAEVITATKPSTLSIATHDETTRTDSLRRKIEVLSEAELTTLDNQPANLRVGKRQGRIAGTQTTRDGQVNSIQMEEVGTILTFTPRVNADHSVTLELQIEDSRLGPEDEGVVVANRGEGKTTRIPNTATFQAQTTLRVASGHTMVVGGMARTPRSGKQQVILVTAHVLPISVEAK